MHNHPNKLLPLDCIFAITHSNSGLIYNNKDICICYYVVYLKKKKIILDYVNITTKCCLFRHEKKKALALTVWHFLAKRSFAKVPLIENTSFGTCEKK